MSLDLQCTSDSPFLLRQQADMKRRNQERWKEMVPIRCSLSFFFFFKQKTGFIYMQMLKDIFALLWLE